MEDFEESFVDVQILFQVNIEIIEENEYDSQVVVINILVIEIRVF